LSLYEPGTEDFCALSRFDRVDLGELFPNPLQACVIVREDTAPSGRIGSECLKNRQGIGLPQILRLEQANLTVEIRKISPNLTTFLFNGRKSILNLEVFVTLPFCRAFQIADLVVQRIQD